MWISVVLAFLRAPVVAAIPLAVRQAFDHAIPEDDAGAVVAIGLFVMAVSLVDAALALVLRRTAARLAIAAVAGVRQRITVRLYALPRSWHDAQDPGMLHAMIVHDCERLLVVLTQLVTWVVPTAVTFVVLAGVAVAVAPGLAALEGVALVVVLVAVVPLARRLVAAGRRNGDALRALSARWRTALRLLPATQAHGAEQLEIDRRQADASAVASAGVALQRTQARLTAAVDAAVTAIGALTLVVGGIGVTGGRMTVGELLSFYAVGILLLRQVSVAAPGLAGALADSSSVSRLVELIGTTAEVPYRGTRAHRPLGGVELTGVTFGYSPVQPVVRDVDLTIEASEHVALLGPNGAGKSTLVGLLLGSHRPDRGQILLDGIAMDELDIAVLRRSIGLAVQDPVLFAGTVAENIAYARPEATGEEILLAAELSTVASFLPALPQGLDTLVGDEGVRLSGGQRQRVALARALLGRPRLVILDEPTTYLDAGAIDDLLDRLERLPAAPTVLIVTHDPRVAARADRIVHLRDGGVERIEPGTRPVPAESVP